MAERQIVFRWIRQHIGAILAAITLSALTVTSLDAGTVTADAIVAGDSSLDVTAGANALALSTTSGGITASTDTGSVTLQASNGNAGSVVVNVNGVSIDGGDGDSVSLGTTDGTTTDLTTLIGLAETVGLGSGGWPSNHYLLLDGVSAQTELGGGGSTLTLTADSAAFDVPVTSPIVAAATAFPTALALGTDIVDATPSLANTTEILSTMTLPAGAFSSDGKTLVVEIVGWAAGNTNTKAVDVLIGPVGSGTGGTGVIGCNFNNAADMQWKITGEIWRRSEDAQGVYYLCEGGNGLTNGIRSRGSSEQGSSSTVDDGEAIEMNVTVVNLTDAADLGINLVRWSWR